MMASKTKQTEARSWSLGLLLAAGALLWLAGWGCMDGAMDSEAKARLTVSVKGSPTAAPGDTVKLTAHVENSSYQVREHSWHVGDPGKGLVATTAASSDGSSITFVAGAIGTYSVICRATLEGTGEVLTGQASVLVEDPSVVKVVYSARITPPPTSGLPPSEQQVTVGRADQTALKWTLDNGKPVLIRATAVGTPRATVLRLYATGDKPPSRDIYLPKAGASVRLVGAFHALFIPQDGSLAPLLKPLTEAKMLKPTWDVAITKGITIQGKVLHGGQGLAGVRVTLQTSMVKTVPVPSTLATTDSTGAFSLQGRVGLAALTVLPPASSGLPAAVVQDSAFNASSDASGWTMTYDKAVSAAKVSGAVLRSDGKTPAALATVQLKLSGKLEVGTLVTSTKTYKATGLVRRTLVTDSKGALKDPASGATEVLLPLGTYEVEIWPGSAAPASEGYTRTTFKVASKASAAMALQLTPRAIVSGKVQDQQGNPVQARLTASGPTGVFTATSTGAGAFSLALDDKATYSLVVRAMATSTSKLGSLVQPTFKVSGASAPRSFVLPPAVTLAGQITTTTNLAVPGCKVRVQCSSGCAYTGVVDETTAGADGSFELRVPASVSK